MVCGSGACLPEPHHRDNAMTYRSSSGWQQSQRPIALFRTFCMIPSALLLLPHQYGAYGKPPHSFLIPMLPPSINHHQPMHPQDARYRLSPRFDQLYKLQLLPLRSLRSTPLKPQHNHYREMFVWNKCVSRDGKS